MRLSLSKAEVNILIGAVTEITAGEMENYTNEEAAVLLRVEQKLKKAEREQADRRK
jgi:hypothetical protein